MMVFGCVGTSISRLMVKLLVNPYKATHEDGAVLRASFCARCGQEGPFISDSEERTAVDISMDKL